MCNYRKGSFVDLKVVVEIGVVPVAGLREKKFQKKKNFPLRLLLLVADAVCALSSDTFKV